MSVTVTRDPRGVRVLVMAPGPQGVKGDQGDQGETGPMPVVGTAAARDVPATGDATSAQVVLGSDTRLTDARTPRAHTHPIADVTGLDTALAGKAPVVHTHDIDDVDALPALLDALALEIDGCAPASHTHAMGQVTGLDTALAGKAPVVHTHVAAQVTDLGSAATCSVPAAGQDAAAAEVVLGRDTRLTNARTPTSHAATHSPGGSDPLPELAKMGNLVLSRAEAQCDVVGPSIAQPLTGSSVSASGGRLLWTATASGPRLNLLAGPGSAPASGSVAVQPGGTVTMQARARSAGAGRVACRVYWFDFGGAPAGNLLGAWSSLATDWATWQLTAVAPAGAVTAGCQLLALDLAVGQVVELDDLGVWLGAGGDWRPPGEPIPGLGWQRRSPAGGVDWVLERWDGAQWVLIDGDTGPRAVGASGRAHRRGQMVTWTATDVAAPVGWRDGYSTGQKCYMTADPWPTGALPGVPA